MTVPPPATLAVDIASSSVNALLHVPDSPDKSLFFQGPSPGRILAGHIRECTALGQGLYLEGNLLDAHIIPPLRSHLRAQLPLYMHPEYAALMSANAETTRGMGIGISETAPAGTVAVKARDVTPAHWHNLMNMLGLPRPEAMYVCATEQGHPLDAAKVRPLAPWLDSLFTEYGDAGIPLERLIREKTPPEMLRLCSIQRITGFSALDSAIAFICGMQALPAVAGRSRREGVVVLHMGRDYVRAALLYREHLFALLELPAAIMGNPRADRSAPSHDTPAVNNFTPETLLQWLDDLRLAWLPAEKATGQGGFLCRAEAFPPEAEGFRPLFMSGANAGLLDGFGQLVCCGPENNIKCRGLLAALAGISGEDADY